MAARHSLHGGTKVTDYDRTTVRETTTDPVADPAVARDRVVSRSYQTGPTPGEVIRRFLMLLFGILQALIIIRIILLLLVATTVAYDVNFVLQTTRPIS